MTNALERESWKINKSSSEASDILDRLAAIDWSFSARGRAHPIEGIHPYPAKFIGELPRALMLALPIPPGTAVLDPFAGSGTTLVEAQRLGYPSIGIDLNPIACLIARVKTGPAIGGLGHLAAELAVEATRRRGTQASRIPNVDHWFKRDIQGAIGALLEELETISDPATADALKLALSSILVRVSNQDSDTRYAAIDKQVAGEDVFKLFATAAEKLQRALDSREWCAISAQVLEANTLEVSPDSLAGKVGLVITSPPYPNAYEYWLYHKYRMWWLGFDPLRVKAQEIGARAHFFKRNHHTEHDFNLQMQRTFALLTSVLVPGGFVSFVVGRSKIHGKIIDNGAIIEAVARDAGFESWARIERTISASRKSFNLAHANIKTESVLVLRKHP